MVKLSQETLATIFLPASTLLAYFTRRFWAGRRLGLAMRGLGAAFGAGVYSAPHEKQRLVLLGSGVVDFRHGAQRTFELVRTMASPSLRTGHSRAGWRTITFCAYKTTPLEQA